MEDMSIDDIISQQLLTERHRSSRMQRPYEGMRRKRFGRIQKEDTHYFANHVRYKSKAYFKWQRESFASVANRNGGADKGNGKLIISNLHFGVTDEDMKELFEDFGRLRLAVIHYDRNGRSLGTAEIAYTNGADAAKAIAQYNGLPLDGRLIQINQTIHYSGGRSSGAGGRNHCRARGRGGGVDGRRRCRRRRVGGGNRQKRTQVTKEQLDAELADYMSRRPN